MFNLAYRNLVLFFRDRTTVVLSFLAEFIVVILYILFLRDNLIQGFAGIEQIELLTDVWMIAGLLGISSVTTTIGAMGIMVEDRVKRIEGDFRTMPMSETAFVGGYLLSTAIIGLLLSVVIYFAAQVYLFMVYHIWIPMAHPLRFYLALICITISNSGMVLFGVSFLKSSNALAACCTIVGALIGFLTGIYLPMGTLSKSIQSVVQGVSASHGVAVLRQLLMEELISVYVPGEAGEYIRYMGISFYADGKAIPMRGSMIFVVTMGVVFLLLAIARMLRKQ